MLGNGTEEQYFTLYDYAVANVKRALPSATVGGPEVAGGPGGDWLGLFLDHAANGTDNATGGTGTTLDFISFHAKGSPIYVNETGSVPAHVQMNVSAALQNVNDAFQVIESYPMFNTLPVFIGEDDPDGCAACTSDAYSYRNNLVYPSYTAASFVGDLDLAMQYNINLTGTLTWAFEYDDHPYFDGFRVLATNQLDKPILNIFRMFGKLTGNRLLANSTGQYTLDRILNTSVRNESDVGVLAAFNTTTNQLAVMIYNYHDDDLPKPDAQISLNISGLTGEAWSGCNEVQATHYRIDNSHSNSYTAWLELGAPQDPTCEEYAQLKAAGMLQTLGPAQTVRVDGGNVSMDFSLGIHAISLLVIEKS